MLTLTRTDGYELCTDPDRIDVDRVHRWLSTEAYWARDRPYEVTARAIANSMVFGVYRPGDGIQVAFARVVTDRATVAWLSDVFVDPAERGRGLGGWLAATARDAVTELGVYRMLLATDDAHGVYAQVGFTSLAKPQNLMELMRPQPWVTPVTDKEPNRLRPLR
ncbi:acetyltransferase (GNAT) family protein [Micromonospora pisi]|uniref:Acetyltransferase (GNAT) family protein n=1 Tax=Micromonospora pisi TaxID=589240 RepID=A0A495JL76_9ACTN|nr:GNAT family N-acetyltransferase [Micromonospora pisi]RKR89756.1 acetyltransferase (GNAT) family protein [Micromonospora pisi]